MLAYHQIKKTQALAQIQTCCTPTNTMKIKQIRMCKELTVRKGHDENLNPKIKIRGEV
jgi:hypothetical protein